MCPNLHTKLSCSTALVLIALELIALALVARTSSGADFMGDNIIRAISS